MDTSLAGRLKEERKRLKMRQEDAAARAGVSRETWVRYEGGSMQPGTDVWLAVAAMGADIQYIFTGKRDEPRKAAPLSGTFHRESSDGVEAVLQRMAKTIGADPSSFGYARILDVSERVLSGWRKRGEVAIGFIDGFAREYGTTIDWLLRGVEPQLAEPPDAAHQVNQSVAPYGLSADETMLLETYREIDPEARGALQNLLKCIAGARQAVPPPPGPPGKKPASMAHVKVYSGNLPDKKFVPPAGKRKKAGEA